MVTTGLLLGKRALVVGLMNKHSIAASVVQALLAQGARVVVASKLPLSASQRAACGFRAPDASALQFAECDVQDEHSVQALAEACGDAFDGQLDVLVHSVAFAPKEAFPGDPRGFLGTSKAAWTQAMDISAYSLVALTRATYPLLQASRGEGGEGDAASADRSVIAMTYAGSSKVMPSYNVMGPAKAALEAAARQLAFELGPDGIRVNCVSPGPMNTVSARGIPGISVRESRERMVMMLVVLVLTGSIGLQKRMRKYAADHAPLRRTPVSGDVGAVTAFLASDLASSISGQTIYGEGSVAMAKRSCSSLTHSAVVFSVDGGLSAMAPYVRDESGV